jgi:hypothetical protein
MPNATEHKKRAILEALEKSLGVVTTACKAVDISRTQFYQWLKDDPEFKAAVEDTGEMAIDYVESNLMKAVRTGNVTAMIFYLKTKGKKRGYIEGQEVIQYNPDARPSWFDGSEIEG